MNKIKIKVGDKEYTVEVAKSEEEKSKALQGVDSLEATEGMLFEFEESDNPIIMWMKDCKIPLDIIFINDDLEVIYIEKGVPESEEFLEHDNVSYVLEVNLDSGIKVGDELEFISNSNLKKDKMYVLDENGASQMELLGGERIFSRSDTKKLIKFVKKADLSKNDNDYKTVGKRVFKFIQVQDEREPDFVESKK